MTVKTTGHGRYSGFLQDQIRLLNLFLHWTKDWELTCRMETKLSFVSAERKIGNLLLDGDFFSSGIFCTFVFFIGNGRTFLGKNINEIKYKRT
jgi:hypothetical protein